MSKALSRVLLIEGNPDCQKLLPSDDFDVERADRLSVGLEKLDGRSFDLIVLGLGLPDSQGLLNSFGQTRAARAANPDCGGGRCGG